VHNGGDLALVGMLAVDGETMKMIFGMKALA